MSDAERGQRRNDADVAANAEATAGGQISAADQRQAEQYKDQGNKAFAAKEFDKAVELFGGKPTPYTDYRKLLEQQDVEAVFIATPLFMHYPIMKTALEAGKHVFSEKPLTTRCEDAKALVVIFMCNHCPYVVHIADAFSAFAREYQDKGLAIVAISANDVLVHDQALEKLAAETVAEVKESGDAIELDPMTPFERKVVHDAVAAAGLVSDSEGVEPRRYVVVKPA